MSKLAASLRLLRVGFILAREGVLSALPSDGLPATLAFFHRFAGWFARKRSKKTNRSENMSRAMTKLGRLDGASSPRNRAQS